MDKNGSDAEADYIQIKASNAEVSSLNTTRFMGPGEM